VSFSIHWIGENHRLKDLGFMKYGIYWSWPEVLAIFGLCINMYD